MTFPIFASMCKLQQDLFCYFLLSTFCAFQRIFFQREIISLVVVSRTDSSRAEFSEKTINQLKRDMTRAFTFKESERETKLQTQIQFLKRICSKQNENLVRWLTNTYILFIYLGVFIYLFIYLFIFIYNIYNL